MADSLQGLRDFLKKYASLIEDRQKNIDTAATEFQAIKQYALDSRKDLRSIEGAKEHNKKKNRYKDILPYDHSRVILTDDKYQIGSDYINANCIKDHAGNFCYIAAQGPMPSTVPDFWRMIWQYKVKLIVMACREVEMGKPRCQRYWPKSGEDLDFNGIKISMIKEVALPHNIRLRELIANKDGEKRMISQLHFSDWPDHGAPETTEPIIELVKLSRQRNPHNEPPILVHCSAGCGRTGAIIAIDFVQKLIAARASEINISKVVMKLRQQRPAMVQTKEQYEFLYEVFRELITQELNKCDPSTKEDDNSTYVNMCYIRKEVKTEKPSIPENPYTNIDFSDHRPMPTPRKNTTKSEVSLPPNNLVNLNTGFRRSRSLRNHDGTRVPPVPQKLESYSHPPTMLPNSPNLLPDEPVLPPKSPKILRDGIQRVSSTKQSPIAAHQRKYGEVKSKSKSLEHSRSRISASDDVFITLPGPNESEATVNKKLNNVKEGILVDLSETPQNNKPVGVVKPYAITDVGKIAREYQIKNQSVNVGGWNLSVQTGNSKVNTNPESMYANPEKQYVHSHKYRQFDDNDKPPELPERTPESFIIVKDNEEVDTLNQTKPASVGTSISHVRSPSSGTQTIQHEVPSPTAKHLFNAITKVRNMGKANKAKEESNTSPPHRSVGRSASLEYTTNQYAEIEFPRRLSQRPRGPRPPPKHWEKRLINY